MKKNFLKLHITYSIFCITVLLSTLFSCELYTSSLAKELARDQDEILKNLSASALADMATGIESANPETAKAIMKTLGHISQEELTSLLIEDKEAILNLALDATIPIGALKSITEPLIDGGDDVSDDEATDMVTNIINNSNAFDTTALTTLLSDKKTMETADPSTLANAAVASITQIANRVDGGADKFTDPDNNIDFEGESTEVIVEKLLGKDPNETDKDELSVAINVIKLLQNPDDPVANGTGVERHDIDSNDVTVLGVISLDDILSGLGGN